MLTTQVPVKYTDRIYKILIKTFTTTIMKPTTKLTKEKQQHFAKQFRQWHQTPPVLVLPNIWDAVSARLVEQCGARAIATSSAALANTLGYADGEHLPLDLLLHMVERITRLADVPVSVDFVRGYGQSAKEVGESVRKVIDAGAVGINIEDGLPDARQPLRDISEQCERIKAARSAADESGIPLVINARTDAFIRQVDHPEEQAVKRANAYRAAGADCLFMMGVTDTAKIQTLVKHIDAPINVIAGAASPSVSELEALGVARVSVGSHLHQAALTQVIHSTRKLLETGDFTALETELTYQALNQLFNSDN
jgi:2-methylisocitrate lyase-like PEP mutase family enzyme